MNRPQDIVSRLLRFWGRLLLSRKFGKRVQQTDERPKEVGAGAGSEAA